MILLNKTVNSAEKGPSTGTKTNSHFLSAIREFRLAGWEGTSQFQKPSQTVHLPSRSHQKTLILPAQFPQILNTALFLGMKTEGLFAGKAYVILHGYKKTRRHASPDQKV